MSTKNKKMRRNLLIPFPEDIQLIKKACYQLIQNRKEENLVSLLSLIYPGMDIELEEKDIINLALLRGEQMKIINFTIVDVPPNFNYRIIPDEVIKGKYFARLDCIIFTIGKKLVYLPSKFCKEVKK